MCAVITYSSDAQVNLLFQTLKLNFSVYGNSYMDDGADFTTVDLNSLFGNMTWPDLETIQLYGVHLSPSVVSRFLAAHPSIRSLSVVEATPASQFIKSDDFNFLEPKTPDGLSFPSNTLPNITNICVPEYLTLPILASPTPSPRPWSNCQSNLQTSHLNIYKGFLPNIVKLGAIPVSPSGSNSNFRDK